MPDAKQILDTQFLEMRWRCLSLAADVDRIERAPGGASVVDGDPRLRTLRDALSLVSGFAPDRAEQVQLLFSDRTAPPNPKSQIAARLSSPKSNRK